MINNESNIKKGKISILDIALIALFAALGYISLVVLFIPFAGMYIHFGNLIVVLAALLIGGWQGGLSGSIGLGLFDLLNGHPDSAPKTIILKFLIGFTAGLVFKLLNKKSKFVPALLLISSIISLIISGAVAGYTLSQFGYIQGKSVFLFPLFLVVGLLSLLFFLLRNKLSETTSAALVAGTLGMLINITGEFLWKYFVYLISGMNSSAAFVASALGQGSTLINAGIAIIGGVFLYTLLAKPFKRITKK